MSNASQQNHDLSRSNKLLPAESWDYHPLRERFKENAISMGVAVGYGVALSQIFNPVVLGVAALYATGKYLSHRIPQFFEVAPNSEFTPHIEEKKDFVARYYQRVLNAYIQALKLPPQSFHFLKDSFCEYLIPNGNNKQTEDDSRYPKAVTENFAVSSGRLRQVLMSRSSLDRHNHGSVKFILVHELAHTKTKDTMGLFSMISMLVNYMKKPLLYGVYAGAIAPLLTWAAGIPLFSTFTQSVGQLTGFGIFAASTGIVNLGLNYVNRIRERRADRNALFLTRNITDAIDSVVNFNLERSECPKSRFFEVEPHPTVYPRLANLKEAFTQVRQYEPVSLNLPEPPKRVLHARKPMDHIARGKRQRIFETSFKLHGF